MPTGCQQLFLAGMETSPPRRITVASSPNNLLHPPSVHTGGIVLCRVEFNGAEVVESNGADRLSATFLAWKRDLLAE